MASAIITSVILQTTIYSNLLVKYFDKIILNDASHFTKGGQPFDLNLDADANVKNQDLEFKGKNTEQVELKVVGSCRNK